MIELLRQNEELWDLFTRREEYKPLILDQYQRFPYYLSKYRDVFEPKVSDLLMQNRLDVEYPNDKRFAVCLTHDIDRIQLPRLVVANDAVQSLRRLRIGESWRTLVNGIGNESDRLRNFPQIMNLEKKYGAKSSFYFLALDKGDLDFSYRIEELKDELRNIVDSGWEVGLHGGHGAYNNLDQIKKEKDRLERSVEREVIGYRNHFMRFEVPTTWKLLREAGFKYDTTFGYGDCVGFRNGMCHPFKPFDLDTNKSIDILEIPLTIMDVTLYDYMRLDMKNAWEITKRLIDTTERLQGVITILWHGNRMTNGMLEYEDILSYCHKRNAWMTSGEEIWKWWDRNGF